jgi:hypothetical protein
MVGISEKCRKICMFIGGADHPSLRLGLDNCEAVFAKLKGKVAKDAVLWLGGCTIGSNNEFLKKAAAASGCTVVAPAMVLVNKKQAKGKVDMLDRFCSPKVFGPGKDQPTSVNDFCARQVTHRFVVPV